MILHIKEPNSPALELGLEAVNKRLQEGKLSAETIAWHPGLPDWVPLSKIAGVISKISPPPIPASHAGPQTLANETPKQKTSGMAVWGLVLIVLGILTAAAGIGIFLIIGGIVLTAIASRAIKKNPTQLKGKGFVTASRIIVMILALVIVIPLGISYLTPKPSDALTEPQQSAHKLTPAPIPFKTVTGVGTPYTVEVPGDWGVIKNKPNYDLYLHKDGKAVAIGWRKDVFATAETLAEHTYQQLGNGAEISDFSGWSKFEQDGRTWLRGDFIITLKGVQSVVMVWIYAGPEGTYQIRGITKERDGDDKPYAKSLSEVIAVMKTLKLPKPVPHSPSVNNSYVAPDGIWEIDFGGEPAVKHETLDTAIGTANRTTYSVKSDQGFYSVDIAKYPNTGKGLNLSLDGARDGAIAATGATLINERNFDLNGIEGKEIKLLSRTKKFYVISRIYIKDGVSYSTIAINGQTDDVNALLFLDSFAFVDGSK